jgi:hypothetical protein
MNVSRLVNVAEGLAVVALVLDLVNDFNPGSKNTLGIISLATATTAFFVARKKESLIVSGGLVLKGALDTTLAAEATIANHSLGALVFGVTLGSWILILGITESITTARGLRLRGPSNGRSRTVLTSKLARVARIVDQAAPSVAFVVPSLFIMLSLTAPLVNQFRGNGPLSWARRLER